MGLTNQPMTISSTTDYKGIKCKGIISRRCRQIFIALTLSAVLSCIFFLYIVPAYRPTATSSRPRYKINQSRGNLQANSDPLSPMFLEKLGRFDNTKPGSGSDGSFSGEQHATGPANRPTIKKNKAERFNVTDLVREFDFDAERDVLMFMQIPKTGSTEMDLHLVWHTEVGPPGQPGVKCKCGGVVRPGQCECLAGVNKSNVWLFSHQSIGRGYCCLHCDWTELHHCGTSAMDKKEGKKRRRRFLYLTMLRDPVKRYISEWQHVWRFGWLRTMLMCGGRYATKQEVPSCLPGRNVKNVKLDEFMACPSNLASNRQTRMLANLTLVGCYRRSVNEEERVERERLMLRSAMDNLRQMAFFGLTERQEDTQFLFERTFSGIRFTRNFTSKTETIAHETPVSESQLSRITQFTALDAELYRYATELFDARLSRIRQLKQN